LSSNKIDGSIPSSIGQLVRLTHLNMSSNLLIGSIPPTMSQLVKLENLDLSNNKLEEPIPPEIANATSLSYLLLQYNSLDGTIPRSISELKKLEKLDLSHNQLVDSIPADLSRVTSLSYLDLSNNQLAGTIPSEISKLTDLSYLDLVGNNIIVGIPSSMSKLVNLVEFLLPDSFCASEPVNGCQISNKTCRCNASAVAPPSNSPPSAAPPSAAPPSAAPPSSAAPSEALPSSSLSSAAIAGIAIGTACVVAALVAVLLVAWRYCGNAHPMVALRASTPGAAFREFTLDEMRVATDDWAAGNRIGSRGFNDVYKGLDPYNTGLVLTVSRARVLANNFKKAVERMGGVRHAHVVALVGFCMEMTPSALQMEQITVYPFMPHGDLEKRLRPGAQAPLSLGERMDILVGTARGLEYLHASGIVHRDVKPSTILLDDRLQARLVDAGFVRVVGNGEENGERVVGTPGYVDPSYAKTHVATPQSDIYSFGVVILEVLTGRRAILVVTDRQMTISQWASQHVDANDIAALRDPELPITYDMLRHLASLALACTTTMPSLRPRLSYVREQLEAVRRSLPPPAAQHPPAAPAAAGPTQGDMEQGLLDGQ
ncbi:hypothetical protein CLOP_g23189, partial [Closterium sp. NIES-67]